MNKLSTTPYSAFQTLLCSKNFLLKTKTKTRIYSSTKQNNKHFFVYINNQQWNNKQCGKSSGLFTKRRKCEETYAKNDENLRRNLKISTEKEVCERQHLENLIVYTNNHHGNEQYGAFTRRNERIYDNSILKSLEISNEDRFYQQFFVYTNNLRNDKENEAENGTPIGRSYTGNQRNDKQNGGTSIRRSYTRNINEATGFDGSRSELERSIEHTRNSEQRWVEQSRRKCNGMKNDGVERGYEETTNRNYTNSNGIKSHDEVKKVYEEITNRTNTNSYRIKFNDQITRRSENDEVQRYYDEITNRTNTNSYGIESHNEITQITKICEETKGCLGVTRFDETRKKDGTKSFGRSKSIIQVYEGILRSDRKQIYGERRQFFHILASNNGWKNMNGVMKNYMGEESREKNLKSLEGVMMEKSSLFCKNGNRRNIFVSAYINKKNEISDKIKKGNGGEKEEARNNKRNVGETADDVVGKQDIRNKMQHDKSNNNKSTNNVNEIRNTNIEDTSVDNGNTKENRDDATKHQSSQTSSEAKSKPNSQYANSGSKNTFKSDVFLNANKDTPNVFESAHKEFQELLNTQGEQMVMDKRPAVFKGDKIKAGKKAVAETMIGSEGSNSKGSDNLESGRGSLQIGSQFETEVQFSYDDLISFGKLSRDWNPIHYYPDDGRVQHLSKMFRIKSLDEIQGIPEKSSPDQTPTQSISNQPNSVQLQQNSKTTNNLVNKPNSNQVKLKSNDRKPIGTIASEDGQLKLNLKAEKSATNIDKETISEKSTNKETSSTTAVHSIHSSLDTSNKPNTKLQESSSPLDSASSNPTNSAIGSTNPTDSAIDCTNPTNSTNPSESCTEDESPASPNVPIIPGALLNDIESIDLTEDEIPISPHVPIIPGALLNDIISGMIGTHLPGPGTLILSQTLDYKSRLFVDEKVRLRVRVVNVRKMLVWVSYKAWVKRKKEGMTEKEKVVVLKGDAKLVYRR